jgi:DHA1 family bicyclomycin/chloramphenicol resistance-like MFS transporter
MTRQSLMSERRTSLIAAMLVALGPVSMALYTPAMPQLVAAFETTPGIIKSTLTAYFAGFAVAQLAAGPIADAFGRRKATLLFMAVYLAGSLAAAFAPTVEMLIVARLVQGIGAAVGVTVARAIVRDLFPGDAGARIMNMVGIMLAIAPAFSPAIGGVTLALAGWQAIFLLMIVFGLVVSAVVMFAMEETTVPDPSLVRPMQIARSYLSVLRSGEFVSSSITVACAIGAFYALATILPFVMIDVVGLTPTEFGFSMLLQSGSFFAGSLACRYLLRGRQPQSAVIPGLAFIGAGSVGLLILPGTVGANIYTVMGPVALYAVGIAFVMPFMLMASLRPFPRIAGSASAMTGFIQMGAGLLGGTAAAWIGDPVLSVSQIIPAMGLTAGLSYAVFLRAAKEAKRRESIAAASAEVPPVPAE